MANFTFGEILTIVIVILIVFGPNRLPELARKAGALLAKARVAVTAMRDEVTAEYRDVVEPMQEVRDELKAAGRDLRQDVTKIRDDVKAAGDEAVTAAKSLEDDTEAHDTATATDAGEGEPVAATANAEAGGDTGHDETSGVATLPGGDRPGIEGDEGIDGNEPGTEAAADPAAEESA